MDNLLSPSHTHVNLLCSRVSKALSDFKKLHSFTGTKYPQQSAKQRRTTEISNKYSWTKDTLYLGDCARDMSLNLPIGRILGQCPTTTLLNRCFFGGQPAWTALTLCLSNLSGSVSEGDILEETALLSVAASDLALLDGFLAVRARCWKMTKEYIFPWEDCELT